MTNNLARGVDVAESMSKVCVRCGETKPAIQYYKRARAHDGLNPACKSCLREDRRRRRSMTDEDRRRALEALANRRTKACGNCGEQKSRAAFPARSRSRDGLAPWCKECSAAYSRTHYLANKAKVAARAEARYAANKDLRNEQQRTWYAENKARSYATSRRWLLENPERATEYARRRRAVLRETTVGPVDLDALWTGGCGLCGQAIDRDLGHPDPMSKSVDHIVPLARGGTHTQGNLQWTHLRCNVSKGTRVPN